MWWSMIKFEQRSLQSFHSHLERTWLYQTRLKKNLLVPNLQTWSKNLKDERKGFYFFFKILQNHFFGFPRGIPFRKLTSNNVALHFISSKKKSRRVLVDRRAKIISLSTNKEFAAFSVGSANSSYSQFMAIYLKTRLKRQSFKQLIPFATTSHPIMKTWFVLT